MPVLFLSSCLSFSSLFLFVLCLSFSFLSFSFFMPVLFLFFLFPPVITSGGLLTGIAAFGSRKSRIVFDGKAAIAELTANRFSEILSFRT